MTRANAANAEACPDVAASIARSPRSEARDLWRLAPERCAQWAPRAALTASAVLLAILIGLTLQHLRRERQHALEDAAREVDMRATVLAARLDRALAAAPNAAPGEVLREVLSAYPELRTAQALLADREGRLIASDPPRRGTDATLNGVLGAHLLLAGRLDTVMGFDFDADASPGSSASATQKSSAGLQARRR